MKIKFIIPPLLLLVLLIPICCFSKENDNTLSVYFTKGVSQKNEKINEKTLKKAFVSKADLKKRLKSINLTDSLIEPAMPFFNQKDTIKILSDGRKIRNPNFSNLYKVKVPKNKTKKEILDYLRNQPEVLFVEYYYAEASPLTTTPNDVSFLDQWGLRNSINPDKDISAEEAWGYFTGNPKNIIAIIDGGVSNHIDLYEKMDGGDTGFGWDGHGTRVAGVAAAITNNNEGIAGVDWNAKIHSQRVDAPSSGSLFYSAVKDAVDYSNYVRVINNSFEFSKLDHNRYYVTAHSGYAYAYKANRVCVAAIGNHQDTEPGVICYPAGLPNVIAVGATTYADNIYPKSVQGNHIDVCAPGVSILSTWNAGYDLESGTSLAAPFVSGLASLLKGRFSGLTNDDIRQIIRLSADKVSSMNGDNFTVEYGYGRINAAQAMKYLEEPYKISMWTATGGTIVNSTPNFTYKSVGAEPGDGNYVAIRHEVQKNVTFPVEYMDLVGVWGRGIYTDGYRDSEHEDPQVDGYNFGEGFCELVPGTATSSSATLRTYVYEINGNYYPSAPGDVEFAYTVLGVRAPEISGPDEVCALGRNYEVPDLPPGSTVTWSTSSNINMVSQQGSNPCMFEPDGTGAGYINATINHATYGVFTLNTKHVWVGDPDTPTITSGPSLLDLNDDGLYRADMNCDWSFNYPTSLASPISNGIDVNYWRIQSHSTEGFITIRAEVSNACGTKYDTKSVYIEDQGGGGPLSPPMPLMQFYPNPTSEVLNVSVSDVVVNDIIEKKSDKYQLLIYDKNQKVRYNLKSDKKNISINTSDLEEGFYYLHFKYKDNLIREQIVIKK